MTRFCIVFVLLLVLSLLFLFYVGAFAPIISEVKCGFFTKVRFGVMLRCQCALGLVRYWQVDAQDQAHASLWKPGSSDEFWDVTLDGRYFRTSAE